MAQHKVESTDVEIDAALAVARQQAHSPHVVRAEYLPGPGLDLIILHMSDGRRCVLPREELQGLQDATPSQLAHIELLGRGTGLHWPELDADLYVPALLEGIYGTPRWMDKLSRTAPSGRTPAAA